MLQLKLETVKLESGKLIKVVDAGEMHKKLGDRRPFGLWFASFRRGLPALVDGENILRRWGDAKRTLIAEDIASHIMMMSNTVEGDE